MERLLSIRWATFIAYCAVWFLGVWFLGAAIVQPPLFVILCLLFSSNLILGLTGTRSSALLIGILLLDLCLLSLFLFFYGGYANPFAMMFLVYVSIAALLVSSLWSWIVFAVSVVLYSGLFFWHVPIPAFSLSDHHAHGGHAASGFSLHLYGMLFSFFLTGTLITFFLTKMRTKLDERQKELLAVQQIALQQQTLARISALAAQSAHELGTPLASMSLVAESLQEEDLREAERAEQVGVLITLLQRCKEILSDLRERFQASADESATAFSIAVLLESVIEKLHASYPTEHPIFEHTESLDNIIVFLPRTGAVLSIVSLVDNAARYGHGLNNVGIAVRSQKQGVLIEISDSSGTPISLEKLKRTHLPFMKKNADDDMVKEGGLGIGIFLAQQYLDSIGGSLEYTHNQINGTTVSVFLPYGQ